MCSPAGAHPAQAGVPACGRHPEHQHGVVLRDRRAAGLGALWSATPPNSTRHVPPGRSPTAGGRLPPGPYGVAPVQLCPRSPPTRAWIPHTVRAHAPFQCSAAACAAQPGVPWEPPPHIPPGGPARSEPRHDLASPRPAAGKLPPSGSAPPRQLPVSPVDGVFRGLPLPRVLQTASPG